MQGSRLIMNLNFLLISFLIIFCFSKSYYVLGNIDSIEDDIALKMQLKAFNKRPRKTFKTREGDTIDCIDIDKQPALDHPLLKNHKVQRKPSSSLAPFDNLEESKLEAKSLWFGDRKPCPHGTVPIKRIKKEDLIRIRSIPHEHLPFSTTSVSSSDTHLAFVYLTNADVSKYAVGGTVTVWNVSVAPDQYSAACIWVKNGPNPLNQFSMITAGWMASPELYGDNVTRLFTYWTGDAYRNGCYDALCHGFVQVDTIVTPSFPLRPISKYGGPLYEFTFEISQDRETGNWWLMIFSHRNISVGYWPNELLPYLKDGSINGQWGGLTKESKNGTSPPMGSGHKPDGNLTHTCYFKKIYYTEQDGIRKNPGFQNTLTSIDSSNCYSFTDYQYIGESMGYTFAFGGPGGTGKCKE